MNTKARLILASIAIVVVATTGCTQKVRMTIRNHGTTARKVQLTAPDGTRPLGIVNPSSMLTHTFKIKKDELPAQCQLSAGAGAFCDFDVNDETPERLFFHISSKGQFVGPMTENDVYVEKEDRGKVDVTTKRRMIVE
jgi:hypothetical protein